MAARNMKYQMILSYFLVLVCHSYDEKRQFTTLTVLMRISPQAMVLTAKPDIDVIRSPYIRARLGAKGKRVIAKQINSSGKLH